MSTWRQRAYAVMLETLMACRKDGKPPEETAKAIDAAYPFGERAHHPYKMWLKVRQEFFAKHGLPRRGDHRTQEAHLNDLVARMEV